MKQSHKIGLFPSLCYIMVVCLNLGWLWMKDRWSLTMQMAIPVLSFLLGGLGVWWRTQGDTNIETTSYLRKALWVFTLYYMAILSVLLFFGGLFHLDRGWGGNVNLVPFHTIHNYIRFYRNTGSMVSVFNLVGNIVITFPLGMLLPLLWKKLRHWFFTLPILAVFCVGVEYLQWLTATGTADIDDSILNFVGGCVGYGLARLGQMIWNWRKRR